MDLRQNILLKADELFCRFGIKRITMDEIAMQMGMSKKTLYQHFKNKDELVYAQVQYLLNKEQVVMDASTSKSTNSVETVFLLVTILKELLSKIDPILFYDIQRYHPKAWQLFKDFRYNYMKECVLENLTKGIEEENFRKDINCEIIALMRLDQVDMIFNQLVFPPGKFSMQEVMTQITEHYLYGLCTVKGHNLINSYKQSNQN